MPNLTHWILVSGVKGVELITPEEDHVNIVIKSYKFVVYYMLYIKY